MCAHVASYMYVNLSQFSVLSNPFLNLQWSRAYRSHVVIVEIIVLFTLHWIDVCNIHVFYCNFKHVSKVNRFCQ